MLFPYIPAEPMRWTGDVRAFAYYVTPECLPEERIATIYVARKTFEDGSTTTVIRNIPRDSLPYYTATTTGQGLVERDPSGTVVRLKIVTEERPRRNSFYDRELKEAIALRTSPPTSFSGVASTFVKNRLANIDLQLDPSSGFLKGSWRMTDSSANLEFTQPKAYWLDPLEALAFGSPASLSAGWLLPAGSGAFVAHQTRTVGQLVSAVPKQPFALELNGNREMFRRVDLVASFPGTRQASDLNIPGVLLLRSDGRLAAFIPTWCIDEGPGTVMPYGGYGKTYGRKAAAPPFPLKGKLKEAWDRGLPVTNQSMTLFGIYTPFPVAPNEFQAMLASIPDRNRSESPKEESTPVDG